MAGNDGTILMENAELTYRNFSGIAGMYNDEGQRNFCVFLDTDPSTPDLAERLKADGWNVKHTKQREDGDEPRPYLQVSIGYKIRPPRVVMITSKGRTDVPEDLLGLLDWVDIAKVDLIIRPYHWNKGGNTGVKAYLKSLYITIAEDFLEQKYADIEEYQIDGRAPMLQLTDHAHEPSEEEMLEGEVLHEEMSR